MKIAKIISYSYLVIIALGILAKGIPETFNFLGWFGGIMITISIVIVAQKGTEGQDT